MEDIETLTKNKIKKAINEIAKDNYIKEWLDDKTKDLIVNNDAIIECIQNCTSPDKEKIFNALTLFKPEETRILILGQDPYPEQKKAHGLAFSVKNEYTEEKGIDASLLNIFKAISKYNGKNNFKDWDTNLENWAKNNGVLLLNTALTYEQTELHKNIESKTKQQNKEIDNAQKRLYTKHKNAWKCLFNNIVSTVLTCNNKKFVVFLCGRKAEKAYHDAVQNLKEIKKDLLVLTTSHPSPQGVKFGFKDEAPNHFEACDDFLGEINGKKTWFNFPENNEE